MSSLHTISEQLEPQSSEMDPDEFVETDEPLEFDSEDPGNRQTEKQRSFTLRNIQTRQTSRARTGDPKRSSSSGRASRSLRQTYSKVDLPQWLINVMWDIEEATTHKLTVE